MSEGMAAAARVINTAELLEAILLHLKPDNISVIRCRLVNKAFHDTSDRLIRLRRLDYKHILGRRVRFDISHSSFVLHEQGEDGPLMLQMEFSSAILPTAIARHSSWERIVLGVPGQRRRRTKLYRLQWLDVGLRKAGADGWVREKTTLGELVESMLSMRCWQ